MIIRLEQYEKYPGRWTMPQARAYLCEKVVFHMFERDYPFEGERTSK